jgi:hypothetical protein
LVDLDADGHLDLISGSWPGELFLFRGGKERTFAAPEMLKDKAGEFINVGGGIKEQDDGSLLITGNADFDSTDEGTFAVYHGKRIKSTADKPISITGTASAVHAFDWDGDGDLDLLVGDIGGNVYLVPNEGTPKAWAFGKHRHLEAGGEPITVQGDAGPFVADWDGDGDADLLVGAGDGSVSLFRNGAGKSGTGKSGATKGSREPKLGAAEELLGAGISSNDDPKEARRGIRAKVCAVDWNGDGRLDLMLGDYGDQKPDVPEPTPEQAAEHDKIRKQIDAEMERYQQLVSKLHGQGRVKDSSEREKLSKELQQLGQSMQALRAKIPPESESHGWVWLFLRKK